MTETVGSSAWLRRVFEEEARDDLFAGHAPQEQPVLVLLAPRIAVTMWLVFFGLVGSLLIALPAGMVAALKRRSWPGFTISAAAQLGMAVPAFWGGIMLILLGLLLYALR